MIPQVYPPFKRSIASGNLNARWFAQFLPLEPCATCGGKAFSAFIAVINVRQLGFKPL